MTQRDFHISRAARAKYQFDAALFGLNGNVIFANLHAARVFAQRVNDKRDLARFPEQVLRAGQLNAMGLIDELLHYVVGLYREQRNPRVMEQALAALDGKLGREAVDAALLKFADEFPTIAVYQRETSAREYLDGATDGVPHRQLVLEEMLMLWVTNVNPACAPFLELFDDAALEATAYPRIVSTLRAFFDAQPAFGPDDQNLLDMLRSPALAVPHSLSGQLEYILQRWGLVLGKYLYRLLGGLDLIKEEEKIILFGPGVAHVPVYDLRGLDKEAERFSPDREWMPRLVLLAKSAYVWLDQLSKKYQRDIARLDQIPDRELDLLAQRGFTGLWLIGIWERSAASRRIKNMMGKPDAVASAYSLHDYSIAHDLGGDAAHQNLKTRAWQRGIRLASDMVPNHTGIDSRWLIEHPAWFVQSAYSPFPAYTFTGPDVSSDARVGIFLEDHYYDRSDAAVVFKRVDRWTGDAKYIYHGNDGTSFPWNDTAQLDYLNPELREAVIQTILHVARQFPIIRFDAAMTLTKKHYQRLWFPQPGTGGDIPSRADFAMSKEQFDARMPEEFWREVVDRVAQEAPDTLLLAEAFWLMEGYFVRTLGMHRVYNSAFMHMLRDEDNAKYRSVVKNTLEFDPEILKRYVNFMNNPDERTALDQFGRDDKYFGVCTMLATLPGLPMFGHGQVEGLSERYGMEYRRASWDEKPDEYLVGRHEREIFPLLHRRQLFAGVENFLLYDFFAPDGKVDEDVFAYSNRVGGERALVVYHNKYAQARGWIKTSVAYRVEAGGAGAGKLAQKNLGKGLGLRNDENYFAIFREHVSGLEYIRSNKELHRKGLYVELGAYKRQVFLDFRQVEDNAWHQYANLAAYLNGRGVPSVEEALRQVFLQAVHQPFGELVNAEMLRRLMAARGMKVGALDATLLLDEVEGKYARLLDAVKQFAGGDGDARALAKTMRAELAALLALPQLEARLGAARARRFAALARAVQKNLQDDAHAWETLLVWVFVHTLGKVKTEADAAQQSRSWLDEWLLGRSIAGALQDCGMTNAEAGQVVQCVKLLTTHQRWFERARPEKKRAYQVLASWLNDAETQRFLQVNRYQDLLWFNKETFAQWLWWMELLAVVEISSDASRAAVQARQEIAAVDAVIKKLRRAEAKSNYQVEKLLALANR